MTVIVDPGVQPVVVKSNSPCGNTTPAGALPAGGEAGWPETGMNCAVAKAQVAPPPTKLAVMLPDPVGLGPVTLRFPPATVVVAVALPLPVAGSAVAAVTFTVLKKTVPLSVATPTLTTREKVAVAPGASVAAEQLSVPPAPTGVHTV